MPPPPQTVLRRYRVTENRPIADGIFRLLLEPAGEPIPPFQAGQWVGLHLLNPDGSVWAKAAYSIVNAPSAPPFAKGGVELGIKLEGDFTKRAQSLAAGDEVLLQGPWGVFTLPKDQPRLVMFAGGIGVTPLLSMVREVCATDMPTDIFFFYSGRTCAETAYLNELRDLAKHCPRFRLVETCTREPHPEGGKETRRIDTEMLDRYVPADGDWEYLMCGPKEFMDGLKQLLQNRGVDPKKIRKELFS
ncbi:MAG TPA: FAD-dependent oxidoreductase [Candidatus Methylomirabilis sp.]|nr:FAD-dependent oxidoreductase [Candidatus Methylomirabilis sp.]